MTFICTASRCYQADGSGPVDSGSSLTTLQQTSSPHPSPTVSTSPTLTGIPGTGTSSSTFLTQGHETSPSLGPATSTIPTISTSPGPSLSPSVVTSNSISTGVPAVSTTPTVQQSPTSSFPVAPHSTTSAPTGTSTGQGHSQQSTSSGISPTTSSTPAPSSKGR